MATLCFSMGQTIFSIRAYLAKKATIGIWLRIWIKSSDNMIKIKTVGSTIPFSIWAGMTSTDIGTGLIGQGALSAGIWILLLPAASGIGWTKAVSRVMLGERISSIEERPLA